MSGRLGAEAVQPGLDVGHFDAFATVELVQAFLDQGVEAGHAHGFLGVRAVQGCVERDFASGHGVEARSKPGFLKALAAVRSSRRRASPVSHGETIAGSGQLNDAAYGRALFTRSSVAAFHWRFAPMHDFKDIRFGYTSAQTERAEDPDLLRDGYIDLKMVTEEVRDGPKFLFLGYKGAGKSAIGERLKLTSDGKFDEFVRVIQLSDFPFTPFSKIIRGDAEPETKYPSAWSWILLTYLLESFARDEGIRHHNVEAFKDAVDSFRQMGLCPTEEPGKIVRTSAKANFKIAIPGRLAEAAWSGTELRPASEIPDYVESLKELLAGIRSESKHFLVIDGLDDILTSREIQFKSLGALVFEVQKINSLFRYHNVPAKIILLCRTDLFERFQGANKNKIRQDHAIELDWYSNPREPEKSLLVQAAQLRASISLSGNVNLFKDFFVSRVEDYDTRTYLLDMTRHTPRDFLQLLSHLQEFSTPGMLTESEIKAGLRSYSIKYFLPEIQDELSGYASQEEINILFRMLGRLRKRDLKFDELVKEANSGPKKISEERLFEIMQVLFECSAIGNIQHKSGGNTFYTFKYRNRHSSFNEKEGVMLHRGLWKALNLV